MAEPQPPPSRPVAQRRAYHRELEEVRQLLITLAAKVTELIPRGTEVLLTGDLSAAQRLIDDDDEIDQLSVEIEERIYTIFVRQAPMAGELRELITMLKSVGELERSADLVVNVTKAARRMYGAPLSAKVRGLIASMSVEAQRLMKLAVDAFAERDGALAAALGDIDDRLDQLNRDMVEAIFETKEAAEVDLQVAIQLALIARYYERIGDHAVNIGERVAYMVTGWLPEHTGALRAGARRPHDGSDEVEPGGGAVGDQAQAAEVTDAVDSPETGTG
jgi:phosphate transport system protein